MKKFLFIFPLAMMISASLFAGDIGFANDVTCDITSDVVTSSPSAGRGCLCIESSMAAFIKYRDGINANGPWDSTTGNLTCNECHVNLGVPGCIAEGSIVNISSENAALIQTACNFRAIIIRQDNIDAANAAIGGVDRNPDIGGGDPN